MQDPLVLSSLEELLRRPDFILEPKCWATIVKYIESGYPQMASIVCQWLKLADDKGQAHDAGPSTSSQDRGGPSADDAADEFYFLKEFVKQKFDSEKLTGVFTQNSGKPPTWLESLTQDSRGRQLIYELSAAHRNCLLLNYGIQKILMQGHEDEVATVGSSLASYFSVFHRLLVARLRAVAMLCCRGTGPPGSSEAQPPGKADFAGLAQELVDSCGHSLHTYLHAQQLLVWLSGHPNGQVFRRMSQELEQATAASNPLALNLLTLLLPRGSSPEVIKATGLVSAILTSASTQSNIELVHLADLYRNNRQMAVLPIQHPQLIRLLVSSIFTPLKQAADVQAAAMDLLARATCCNDSADDSEGGADGAEAVARIETTREALQAALLLGQHAQSKMSPEDGPAAHLVAEVPAACIGLIHYIKHHLSQWDYYNNEAGSQNATPIFVRLAVFVAKRQPQLLQMVVDMFEAALRALGSQRAELARVFLDASVLLLRDHGWSHEIPDMVDRWGKDADPSLVRYLVHKLLAALAGPYSPAFASWLLRHMTASGIRRGREGQRVDARSVALLQEFAVACGELSFSPPLGSKALALLQDLRGPR